MYLKIALILVACFLWALPMQAEDEHKERELKKILDGLEHGMKALEKLGHHEELEMLERVANKVRKKLKAHREKEHCCEEEREAALHQIEIMRTGMPALLEAGRKDTAELLEHAIHARELALKGRTDDEAMEIRESAPTLGQQVEILNYAASLWDKFGDREKAKIVGGLAEEMQAHHRRLKEAKHSQVDERRIHEIEDKIAELEELIDEYRAFLRSVKKRY